MTRSSKTTKAPSLKQAANRKWEDLLAYHLQLYGIGHHFTREWVAPDLGRRWRWDFADPVNRVLVEFQGAIWIPNKGHSGGTGIMRDHDKLNAAQFHGYRVFHFSDRTVRDLTAVKLLAMYYHQRLGIPTRQD